MVIFVCTAFWYEKKTHRIASNKSVSKLHAVCVCTVYRSIIWVASKGRQCEHRWSTIYFRYIWNCSFILPIFLFDAYFGIFDCSRMFNQLSKYTEKIRTNGKIREHNSFVLMFATFFCILLDFEQDHAENLKFAACATATTTTITQT